MCPTPQSATKRKLATPLTDTKKKPRVVLSEKKDNKIKLASNILSIPDLNPQVEVVAQYEHSITSRDIHYQAANEHLHRMNSQPLVDIVPYHAVIFEPCKQEPYTKRQIKIEETHQENNRTTYPYGYVVLLLSCLWVRNDSRIAARTILIVSNVCKLRLNEILQIGSEKKRVLRLQNHQKSVDHNDSPQSHSSLNTSCITKLHDATLYDSAHLRTFPDGSVHVSRIQEEKEAHPDRISLDRRGLMCIPTIDGESRLRLLSLQHNLEAFGKQLFPSLVFLDIYDNQLEQIQYLDTLQNLRVLLMGKIGKMIKKIEGLNQLRKIEVLDLHGNQITHGGGSFNVVGIESA
ncbi:hypothetical protein NQ317_004714 [Molorchus minor]|uniref:Dynein axonemal assembly factor 1 homolog n=1 Tax=Molorchus minor TaxID=1323400 RepID=A0ABQ9JNA5_9CUCU|nr:hypothetical protein NQ317_004714 [Molorchus minor]